MTITQADVRLLESSMQELAPGYRMLDWNEFNVAINKASAAWKGDSLLYDMSGKMNVARLMRRVVTDPKREGYGVPFAWWWCAFDYRLFPSIKQDPWGEVKWWMYEELRGRRKNLIMHGCQNSGKSEFMGRFAALNMVVWLQHCRIYVSGPYKLAADDKVWGDAFKPSLEAIKRPGNPFADSLMLRVEIREENCNVIDVVSGESAQAKFVSLENAASVQGKKAQSHDVELIGLTGFLVDEFIENPGIKLRQAEGNLASNHNYFGCFGCNPIPSKVKHVSLLKFSDPVEVRREMLSKARNFRWQSAYGIVARFAWQNCPNNILGRTVWPYLLNKDMMESASGKDSDIIASQVDAWAWESSGQQYLDETAVKLAGTYMSPVWRTTQTRLMVIDCAFGGGDPATATIMEAGEVDLPDDYRRPINKPVMGGVEQIVLPVTGDFEFTHEWHEKMLGLMEYTGGSFPDTIRIAPFREGQLLPATWQLAELTIEAAIRHNVPPGNITFDSSQRGDCTEIMLSALGRHNVKWFYDGLRSLETEEQLTADWYIWPFQYEKTDDQGNKMPKKWSELCSRPISMIWIFACNFIRHGNLVNGRTVDKGIDELMARPIEVGKSARSSWKRDVMSKDKLKETGMKSPTWGEGLAMGIYFGVRFLGLIPLGRPELTTAVQQTHPVSGIIRAGMNMRFQMGRKFFSNGRERS